MLWVKNLNLSADTPNTGTDQSSQAIDCTLSNTGSPVVSSPTNWFQKKKAGVKLEVECYSRRKADEMPVRFRLDGHEYLAKEVHDQWYGPSGAYFDVREDDGNLYILRRETAPPEGHGIWSPSASSNPSDDVLVLAEL
jgi:hypothetical protein